MQRASLARIAATISLLFSVVVGAAHRPDSSTLASKGAQNPAVSTQQGEQIPLMKAEGRIHLDVVVTDASGKPVTGLEQSDFTLFDDGKPQKIGSFAAFAGVTAKPDPPVEVILVIDALNNGFVEMGYIRQGLERYLRQNGGQLSQPTSIVRVNVSGMETLAEPSLDGNVLANVVHGIGASNRPVGVYTFPPSINALARLAEGEASRPGRKLLI